MRLATIVTPNGPRLHVRGRSGYVDVGEETGDPDFASLAAVLQRGAAAMDAVRALADLDGREYGPADLGPAVPAPERILCLGLNYREHALEGGREVPTWPDAFVRGRDSVLGPVRGPGQARAHRPVRLRGRARDRHRRGRPVHPGRQGARRDRRVRGPQRRLRAGLAARRRRSGPRARTSRAACRSVPRSSPPTRPTSATSPLTTVLNGQVMQSARTSQMIVDVPSAVEFFSSFTRLAPGDVIATGTPGGVGFARQPPVWLHPVTSSRSPSRTSARSATAWSPRPATTRAGDGARPARSQAGSDIKLLTAEGQ